MSYPSAPHAAIAHSGPPLLCNALRTFDPWVDTRVGLLWQQCGLLIGCPRARHICTTDSHHGLYTATRDPRTLLLVDYTQSSHTVCLASLSCRHTFDVLRFGIPECWRRPDLNRKTTPPKHSGGAELMGKGHVVPTAEDYSEPHQGLRHRRQFKIQNLPNRLWRRTSLRNDHRRIGQSSGRYAQ